MKIWLYIYHKKIKINFYNSFKLFEFNFFELSLFLLWLLLFKISISKIKVLSFFSIVLFLLSYISLFKKIKGILGLILPYEKLEI